MKIDKIIIKNFRNYVGEHYFDLSKEITVFYGDNGFGKSSFFDAIEWCISGTISRFSDEGESEKFKKDLINRYVLTEQHDEVECSITMGFNGINLIRKFNYKNNTFGNVSVKITDSNYKTLKNSDGKPINSRDRVDEYLGGIFQQKSVSNKNIFGKLMKQTYILSQDQVTEFVTSEDGVETFRSIANIMGFKPLLKLSDNMKKILSGLESKNRKLNDELNEKNRSILSKQETKREVDIYKINSNLDILSINSKNEVKDIKKQLGKLRDKKITQKLRQEEQLRLCNRLVKDFPDLDKVKLRIGELKNIERIHSQKLESYRILMSKGENKLQELGEINKDIFTYNSRLEKMMEINQKLEKLQPNTEDLELIKKDLKEKEELSLKYQFAFMSSSNYKSYKQTVEVYEDEQKRLKTKLNKLEALINKRNEVLRRIDDKIIESEDGVLANLLNNIKEIHKFVESNNNHNETCPVCAAVKEEGLLKAIDKNMKYFKGKIKVSTDYANKLLALKKYIKQNIITLDIKIKKIKEESEQLNSNYHRAIKNIEKIERNKLFDLKLMEKSRDIVKASSVSNDENIDKLNSIIGLLLELEILKQDDILNSEKVLLVSEEDIHKSISRLSRAVNRIKNRIKQLEVRKSEQEIIKKLENEVQEFVNKVSKVNIDLPFESIITKIELEINRLNDSLTLISSVERDCEIIEHNNHIQEQIKAVINERSELNNKVVKLNSTITNLSSYIENVFGDFGNNAKDYLNQYYSPIQKYFRYLNPLPTRSSIRFEGEGERLFVKVIFDESDDKGDITTPKNILSSGQLNMLAISIFLAMNDSQKIHELDFIAIDDPIQNMDDINQFSICDVLGSIKKQLIFSTHDFEFLKLFIKKNEHKKDSIQVYNFKSPFLLPGKIEHHTFN
ncbi:SMC family ATPase [Cytobacillus firmus]|uniref:AAA family ATPase n=1 Tax=Cytobacillus firmus TaxID=1399 RepID=UPI001C98AFBD|nr:SMC family ATPase [Cytobacillus firmus]MBY6053429.1 SMC family ATPase [Cytobacillus firmus]